MVAPPPKSVQSLATNALIPIPSHPTALLELRSSRAARKTIFQRRRPLLTQQRVTQTVRFTLRARPLAYTLRAGTQGAPAATARKTTSRRPQKTTPADSATDLLPRNATKTAIENPGIRPGDPPVARGCGRLFSAANRPASRQDQRHSVSGKGTKIPGSRAEFLLLLGTECCVENPRIHTAWNLSQEVSCGSDVCGGGHLFHAVSSVSSVPQPSAACQCRPWAWRDGRPGL